MQRTRAPVTRSSTRACCAVSHTFHRARSFSLSPINATTCSNAILACSNELATITVSPRCTASGPSRLARRNARQQRRLPVAASNRERRRLDTRLEGATHEASFPRQNLKRLSGQPPLGDGQPGQVVEQSLHLVFHGFRASPQRSSGPQRTSGVPSAGQGLTAQSPHTAIARLRCFSWRLRCLFSLRRLPFSSWRSWMR